MGVSDLTWNPNRQHSKSQRGMRLCNIWKLGNSSVCVSSKVNDERKLRILTHCCSFLVPFFFFANPVLFSALVKRQQSQRVKATR